MSSGGVPTSALGRGRASFEGRAWLDSYQALTQADRTSPLDAGDLELLATSAYMLDRDDDYARALERAHQLYLGAGNVLRAVRCAFWVGVSLATRGEMAGASGWFGRGQRLLDHEEGDFVERGYLRIPALLAHVAAGDPQAAYAAAADAGEIAERFRDADLTALAMHEQGHALVRQGRVEDGLRLLDETMVAVTAGELSPIVTGLVYCNVIAFCQEVHEVRRAREWTSALTRWCERQPDMVAHTGLCRLHRAEIMELSGAWGDALEEARRAGERFAQATNQTAAGHASYRQGEVHRLRGESAAAEKAYREASRSGWEPQPGLALLRLAQGRSAAALAAIRRVVGETDDPLKLARLLPAHAEIALAAGDIQEARGACRTLEELSESHEGGMRAALCAQARGAVYLAEGDAHAALIELRRAWQEWQELQAPYEAARARVLVGLACRALGDDDASALELAAARDVFADLGAASDLARVELLAPADASPDAHGLTPRELHVLRLVAAGATNKGIAAELVLSERTVDRHVSNILAKLRVSSRSGATAYAYEHQLV
jgi:DNA-binding CsgD family transcriptional regulator